MVANQFHLISKVVYIKGMFSLDENNTNLFSKIKVKTLKNRIRGGE